jgi:hypothetical protein
MTVTTAKVHRAADSVVERSRTMMTTPTPAILFPFDHEEARLSQMPVRALWSAPRSRSTAFFRSMVERGDVLALHEPLEALHFNGPLQVGGHTFESPEQLLAWLVEDTSGKSVFLKETVNPPVQGIIVRDRGFLAEARHAFLIRRPEEIAASWLALEHDMRIFDTGLELLHDLFVAVQKAGGYPPVVIDSEDLVANPAATMAAYCGAVGLAFVADALHWEPGLRDEWAPSARWHEDTAASSAFTPARPDRHRLATHPEVARFAERHAPFYEELRRHRLVIPSAT